MADKHLLAENTWQEVVRRRDEVQGTVLIPVGSVEQHGAHLPLGTDTFAAVSIAKGIVLKEDCLIAPPVYFGWSPHHMVLPGTVTIRPEVLIEYLYDIVESLSKHGFDKFVLINGHRIVNIAWMQIAAERAKRVLGVRVVIADPAYLSKSLVQHEGLGTLGHADEIESSHMLHSYPELVDMSKAQDFFAEKPRFLNIDPSNADDCLCYVPSSASEMKDSVDEAAGCSGYPSRSSAEKGRVYFEWVTDRLAAVVSWLKTGRG